MAWTAPRHFIPGEMVTHIILNQQLQGNLEFLGSAHSHMSGSAGHGSSVLSSITRVVFSNPGAFSTLSRTLSVSSNLLRYGTGAGALDMAQINASTAFPSLRTLESGVIGSTGSGLYATDGTHSHI